MKTRFLLLIFALAIFGCAASPEKQTTPDNSKSIQRADKSFQELDQEAN